MSDVRSRVAYLQGLAEGLDLDTDTPEGRVLSGVIDVLGDLAEHIDDVTEAHEGLAEYVEDVDFDLGSLEESVYGEGLVHFVSDDGEAETEEALSCPDCGEALAAQAGRMDGAEVNLCCPNCGSVLAEGELVGEQ